MPGHPELYAHHRAISHTAIQFIEARLKMIGIQIDKAEKPLRPFFDSREHLVILSPHVLGIRIMRPLHAHVQARATDVLSVREPEKFSCAFLWCKSGDA